MPDVLIASFFTSLMILGGVYLAIGICQTFFGMFRASIEKARDTQLKKAEE